MNPRLPEIAQAAFACQQKTGCPGLLMIAQCALESGWLASAPKNNCFGIKEYPYCYGTQLLKTTESFTYGQVDRFIGLGGGRTAVIMRPEDPPDRLGRREYHCEDLFATFPTLADCFAKRASMWDKGFYAEAAEQYKTSGNLEAFVRAIGPIYATAPGYADSVLAIIRQADVQQAWDQARQSGGENVTT